MNTWLFKTEPESYSIEDLERAPHQTTHWDGVRNYQARNLLRDTIKTGDRVLIHHSNADPPAIVGVAIVVREGYPDHTAFDSRHEHFDSKSKPEAPTWYMVDLRLERRCPEPLSLPRLKADPRLKSMMLLQRGARLSIQPVTEAEWKVIQELAFPRSRARKPVGG